MKSYGSAVDFNSAVGAGGQPVAAAVSQRISAAMRPYGGVGTPVWEGRNLRRVFDHATRHGRLLVPAPERAEAQTVAGRTA